MRQALLLPVLAALVFTVSGAAAAAADASGEWTWTFSRGDREIEMKLDLKQEGEKLTGKLHLPFGDGVELEIKDGTVKDDKLSFKTVFEREGGSFESKYEGKVEGDTIKGTVERERNGETVSRDWEAKRKK